MKSKSMSATAFQTELFQPGAEIFDFIVQSLKSAGHVLQDGMILAVTSKIISLAENRRLPLDSISKAALVQRESDVYLGEIGYGCHLTVKHGLLIPSAGIDESNSKDAFYILYPEDPYKSARELHKLLCAHYKIQNLGIILTDSHTTPLRRGVTGIALSYWGMRGTRNLIGRPDLYGRPLKMTQINVVDAVASAAVFVMGEADERQPIAIIQGVDAEFTHESDPSEVTIPIEEDLYGPLLKSIGKS
jgi:F420-0:gamma-glutamyl ligase